MLGDGNVYRKVPPGIYRIGIVGSASTVARWTTLLGVTTPPKKFKHANAYQGYLNSKAAVEAMRDLHGICGPKTHSLPWVDVPLEYRAHFIRGLWDTDGSLSIERRSHKRAKGNDCPLAGFRIVARLFVEKLLTTLVEDFGLPQVALVEGCSGYAGKSFRSWGIKWAGSSAMQLADLLYADAPEHLRNEDRVLVYKEQCALRDSLKGLACPRCYVFPTTWKEGLCTRCWWAARPHRTGPSASCTGCGKSPVHGAGLCAACFSRRQRAKPGWARKSTGTCACGKPAYRLGLCDACYSRDRRDAVALAPTQVLG